MSFIEEEYYSDDEFWDSARNENRKIIIGESTLQTQTDEDIYDPAEHTQVLKYLEYMHSVDERFDRAYACWDRIQHCAQQHALGLFDNVEFYHFMKRVFPLKK